MKSLFPPYYVYIYMYLLFFFYKQILWWVSVLWALTPTLICTLLWLAFSRAMYRGSPLNCCWWLLYSARFFFYNNFKSFLFFFLVIVLCFVSGIFLHFTIIDCKIKRKNSLFIKCWIIRVWLGWSVNWELGR